jgi:hypothetical protein
MSPQNKKINILRIIGQIKTVMIRLKNGKHKSVDKINFPHFHEKISAVHEIYSRVKMIFVY